MPMYNLIDYSEYYSKKKKKKKKKQERLWEYYQNDPNGYKKDFESFKFSPIQDYLFGTPHR